MPDLKSPQELLPRRDAERVLELLAELALLSALQDDEAKDLLDATVDQLSQDPSATSPAVVRQARRFCEALNLGGSEWRTQLLWAAQGVVPARRSAWLADLCLYSRFLHEEQLTGGAAMRRLDAVLDLADVPFCVLDVQVTHASLAEDLAAAKVTTSMKVTGRAVATVVGFVGGSFGHVTAGYQASHGVNYLLNRVGQIEPLALQAARIVILAQASADATGTPTAEVGEIWRYLYGEVVEINREHARLRSTPGGPGKVSERSRILEAAEQDARQLIDEGVLTGQPIPDVVGMSLLSANHLLDAINVKVDTYDDTDDRRWQVNTEAWRVRKQVPSGRSVLLHVRKFGE